MPDASLITPTALEIASGVVVGLVAAPAPPSPRGRGALTALEDSVLPALGRPPCLVTFSGGMDSSFVLAVATRVARREGLPDPVPVTWRFTGAPRAHESPWQERVVAGLGIHDWTRLIADDDLDLVGPVAQRLLLRHGVVHPANAHLHQPMIELATGGSVLTGLGGDQVLSGWRRPGPMPRRQAVRARVPGRVVDLVRRRLGRDTSAWLHPSVSQRVFQEHRRELRAEPRPIDHRIRWHARRRDLVMSCSTLDAVAAAHDVLLVNPLVDPGFMSALGGQLGRAQGMARSDVLLSIAGTALPEVATAYRPKAHFLEVFLREPTRQFTRSWAGHGVDERLVDADALARLWATWPIPPGTAALVQQQWLTHTSQLPTTDTEARA